LEELDCPVPLEVQQSFSVEVSRTGSSRLCPTQKVVSLEPSAELPVTLRDRVTRRERPGECSTATDSGDPQSLLQYRSPGNRGQRVYRTFVPLCEHRMLHEWHRVGLGSEPRRFLRKKRAVRRT